MDAGHADVEDRLHLVAHRFDCEDVAGAGADHGDLALAVDGAVPPHPDGARQREVLGVGAMRLHQVRRALVGARGEHVPGLLQKPRGDLGHLLGRLALGQNHLRHAAAQRAVVVDLGEAQVLERHVPQLAQLPDGRP